MNRYGTPAIILIYLMTTLSIFVDRKSLCLADMNSAIGTIDLYSTFQNRLNATSNYAQSVFDDRTSRAVNQIYELAAKILEEQLKEQLQQEQQTTESQNGNYTDKLVDEADPSQSHDILPPAVASASANTAADVAKKNANSINAQVVGSDVNQLDHRRARKIRKASPYRKKKSYYTETNVDRRQRSRPQWANRRMRPSLPSLSMQMGDDGEWQLGPISSIQSSKNTNDDDDWQCKENSHNKGNLLDSDAVDGDSGSERNGLAESIDVSNGSNQHGLPSDKWRRKSIIDGRRKNFRNRRSWPNLLKEQSNGLIESDDEVGETEDKWSRKSIVPLVDDFGSHIKTRSTDSFPEVFSKPLVDSNSISVISAGNELSEALKTANSVLASVQNIPNTTNTTGPDDVGQHISKQMLEGLKPYPGSQPVAVSNAANLTDVLEQVLGELENLKECNKSGGKPPEGTPCDIVGTWNSEIIGLQFHMSLADVSLSSGYIEGKKIDVEVTEKVPPRRHDLMGCDWDFTARTVRQIGGPFYMTALKSQGYNVATFAGLCKTCGGVPTIFGSWTFVNPAKDCQDISLSVDNKRDVFRKDTLQAKLKHRREKADRKGKSSSGTC